MAEKKGINSKLLHKLDEQLFRRPLLWDLFCPSPHLLGNDFSLPSIVFMLLEPTGDARQTVGCPWTSGNASLTEEATPHTSQLLGGQEVQELGAS